MVRIFEIITVCAGFAVLPGCARTILIAEDAVVRPDRPHELAAYVDKQWLVVFTSGVPGREVQFLIDEKEVGRARTNKQGRARITLKPGVTGESFIARTHGDIRNLQERATLFGWDPNRTAIAVDVDETISLTNYLNVIWGDGLVSRPVKGSPEALRSLAKNYQLLYYSARPRFMIRRTHEWLEKYGFPPGPVVFPSDFTAALRQSSAKAELLASLREKWPNLRIGIGDKHADVDACIANDMLPVIVNGARPKFRKNAIVVAGWESVPKFFDMNRGSLNDDRRIASFLANGNRSASGDIIPPPEPAEPTRVVAAKTK
ncbi:MAG TPA: hypothetical protein VJZ71_08170 [Phycisphaerae bacterium]|nr:hypothetical protein [Phycisphaerae bacterium]